MNKKIFFIFLRYIALLLIALPNLFLLYFIFTPLTTYPIFYLLKMFFNVYLEYDTLFINSSMIQLVKACIAGSAYYLLLILNLTTPMPPKKRFFSILFSLSAFLIINILRIFLFIILFLKSFSGFDFTHLFFWYFISSVLVVLIWIATIKIFKIKEIPIYSDIKHLFKKTKK